LFPRRYNFIKHLAKLTFRYTRVACCQCSVCYLCHSAATFALVRAFLLGPHFTTRDVACWLSTFSDRKTFNLQLKSKLHSLAT